MKIDQVIKYFGSGAKLARVIGVHRCTVSKWRAQGEIPELRQYQIEALTKGELRAKSKDSTP